jgi:hypothetical protein
MSTVLAKWMTLLIAITIMFTPLLVYLDSLHREAIDLVLHEGMKDASIQGGFTTEIVADMKDALVKDYNFDPNVIDIEATHDIKERGEYIEATIRVPRSPIFILGLFNEGPKEIVRTAKIMSEHI